jgi:hypothetical protein
VLAEQAAGLILAQAVLPVGASLSIVRSTDDVCHSGIVSLRAYLIWGPQAAIDATRQLESGWPWSFPGDPRDLGFPLTIVAQMARRAIEPLMNFDNLTR